MCVCIYMLILSPLCHLDYKKCGDKHQPSEFHTWKTDCCVNNSPIPASNWGGVLLCPGNAFWLKPYFYFLNSDKSLEDFVPFVFQLIVGQYFLRVVRWCSGKRNSGGSFFIWCQPVFPQSRLRKLMISVFDSNVKGFFFSLPFTEQITQGCVAACSV